MSCPAIDDTDRYLRHSGFLPQALLRRHPVTVVGVGAIGRQVAMQLGVMGVGPLTLIDPDAVETVNLGAQGFAESDLGNPKVEATAELIQGLNRTVQVIPHARRFRRSEDTAEVLFCCVDRIETRGHIFRAIQDRVRCFIDGRMSAESLRILTVGNALGLEHYPRTLFTAAQAQQGACTARTTFYTATIAAGLMVSLYGRWLRGLEIPVDLVFNLLADELVVQDAVAGGEVAHGM